MWPYCNNQHIYRDQAEYIPGQYKMVSLTTESMDVQVIVAA